MDIVTAGRHGDEWKENVNDKSSGIEIVQRMSLAMCRIDRESEWAVATRRRIAKTKQPGQEIATLGMNVNAYRMAATGPSTYTKVRKKHGKCSEASNALIA